MNGVWHRAIKFGNPYHIGNLVVMYFSRHAYGDKEQGAWSQNHHLQLMGSVHSLHSKDTALSQKVLDDVMRVGTSARSADGPEFSDSELDNELADAHTKKPIVMMSWNERQQRWLVNQRNARWIIETNQRKMPKGVPALLAWAIAMKNTVQSKWLQRVAGKIAIWL